MRQLNEDVAEGADGNLFLTRGRHNVFALATGEVRPPERSIKTFADNIAEREQHCSRSGVAYRHVIFPDKQTVLRHSLPEITIQGLGEVYLRDVRGESVLYLEPQLTEAAQTSPVFLALDTHMSDLGNVVAVCAIVDALRPGLGAQSVERLRGRLLREVDYVGDLGGKLDPVRTATKTILRPDWPVRRFTNNYGGGNDGIIDIFLSPDSVTDDRLVLFGDSFARSCLMIFSAFYREILFVRTRFFHPEIVELAAPDVVLTQNVERYLANVAADDRRPHALLYPGLNGNTCEPDPGFTAALDAFLAHRFDPDRMQRVSAP